MGEIFARNMLLPPKIYGRIAWNALISQPDHFKLPFPDPYAFNCKTSTWFIELEKGDSDTRCCNLISPKRGLDFWFRVHLDQKMDQMDRDSWWSNGKRSLNKPCSDICLLSQLDFGFRIYPNWISDFFSPPPASSSSCLRELFTGGNHSGRVYLLQFSAARAWVSGLSRPEPRKNWLPVCALLHCSNATLPYLATRTALLTILLCIMLHSYLMYDIGFLFMNWLFCIKIDGVYSAQWTAVYLRLATSV